MNTATIDLVGEPITMTDLYTDRVINIKQRQHARTRLRADAKIQALSKEDKGIIADVKAWAKLLIGTYEEGIYRDWLHDKYKDVTGLKTIFKHSYIYSYDALRKLGLA